MHCVWKGAQCVGVGGRTFLGRDHKAGSSSVKQHGLSGELGTGGHEVGAPFQSPGTTEELGRAGRGLVGKGP